MPARTLLNYDKSESERAVVLPLVAMLITFLVMMCAFSIDLTSLAALENRKSMFCESLHWQLFTATTETTALCMRRCRQH